MGGGTTANLTGPLAEGVKKTAAELAANKGAALVVCGSNDVNVQVIVNAINDAIGANGNTIDRSSSVNYRQGVASDMVAVTQDLNSGAIGALLVYEANPVYSYFDSAKLAAGIQKCPFTLSYSEKMDETTELCKYNIPSHHWLESWGDAELQKGYISVIQPLIHPLFKTRQFQSSLLKLTGNTEDYATYFRNYWTGRLGGLNDYQQFLQDGVIENSKLKTQPNVVNVSDLTSATAVATASFASGSRESADTVLSAISPKPLATATPVAATTTTNTTPSAFVGNVTDAATKIGSTKGGEIELVLYQKISIGTGVHASNAWLQEVSDPVTKATWDNYAMVSPEMGKKLFDIDIFKPRESDKYEVHPDKPEALSFILR